MATSSIEEWKKIEGFENYEVSSLGRFKANGKLLANNRRAGKYASMSLSKDKKKNFFDKHRLVALAFIKPINGKDFVNHKNGDKQDNRVENLEWVTPSENNAHAMNNGLHRCGENRVDSKMTAVNVKFVRENKGVLTHKEFGSLFRVSDSTIGKILKGKSWAHIG